MSTSPNDKRQRICSLCFAWNWLVSVAGHAKKKESDTTKSVVAICALFLFFFLLLVSLSSNAKLRRGWICNQQGKTPVTYLQPIQLLKPFHFGIYSLLKTHVYKRNGYYDSLVSRISRLKWLTLSRSEWQNGDLGHTSPKKHIIWKQKQSGKN